MSPGWQVIFRKAHQGFGMPTVSGDTLALPVSNNNQALACTAGNTAFCAASPEDGANSAPRDVAYFFTASLLEMLSFQIFSTVAITSSGTPLGMKMPKQLVGAEKPGSVCDNGGMVP